MEVKSICQKMDWQVNSSWLLKRQLILWSKQLPTWIYASPYEHSPCFCFLWQLVMPLGSWSEEKSISVKWLISHNSKFLFFFFFFTLYHKEGFPPLFLMFSASHFKGINIWDTFVFVFVFFLLFRFSMVGPIWDKRHIFSQILGDYFTSMSSILT